MNREYIVVIFPSRDVLTKALDYVTQLDYVDIQRAAIVAKAANGETIVLDDKISADEGGITGGTLGAAMTIWGLAQLGALALPGVGPIIALGAGALVGGLLGNVTGRFAANLLEVGSKNHQQVEMLATQLEAGHPALIIEVENAAAIVPRLRHDLRGFQVELVELLRKAQTGQLSNGAHTGAGD